MLSTLESPHTATCSVYAHTELVLPSSTQYVKNPPPHALTAPTATKGAHFRTGLMSLSPRICVVETSIVVRLTFGCVLVN